MDATIHNVIEIKETVELQSNETSKGSYWVKVIKIRTRDYRGHINTETITLFSETDDQCEVTNFNKWRDEA